jgi:hypothetical protein
MRKKVEKRKRKERIRRRKTISYISKKLGVKGWFSTS